MKVWMLTAALAVQVLAARAEEVYVNRWSGSDANDGAAPERAVATLARGVSLLRSGDALVLACGSEPYFETLNLGKLSGEPGRPVKVKGNGAVLSGLAPMPAGEWEAQGDGTYRHPHKRSGSLRPYLMDGDRKLPTGSLDDLPPDSHCWTTNGVWFRPAVGRTLADYSLLGTLRTSGVVILDGSYITVSELTCERFANDGFNVHGGSRGLIFENIVGRHNGDDGFSVHEDVDVTVHKGFFHDNDFGVQDVNASQSVYHGLLVESNRVAGLDFYGGYHGVFDSEVRGNGQRQVGVSGNLAEHLGFSADNPLCTGLAFLKNVKVSGGGTGAKVASGSRLVLSGCVVEDLAVGVDVAAAGVCHAVWTAIRACSVTPVRQAPGGVFTQVTLWAHNPSPADGATNVAASVGLSWTAGEAATSHAVYFGQGSELGPADLKAVQAGTAYAPGPLDGGTAYFWRVDETTPEGVVTGEVWRFSTHSQQAVVQAVPYVETFESYAAGARPSPAAGWDVMGEGTAEVTDEAAVILSLTNGYAGKLALDASRTRVLRVREDATAAVAVESKAGTVVETDFMLLAHPMVDGLLPPLSADAQLSFCVDALGHLVIQHAASEDGVSFRNEWHALAASPVIPEGDWLRLTVVQDYVRKMFQVRCNGSEPVADTKGRTSGGTRPGSWFYMADRRRDRMGELQVSSGDAGYIDDLRVRYPPPGGASILFK